MKIQKLFFATDSFVTYQGQNVKHLVSNDKLDMELDVGTFSVRVNDRSINGHGLYHVPLQAIRQWVPVAEERAVKKASNQ